MSPLALAWLATALSSGLGIPVQYTGLAGAALLPLSRWGSFLCAQWRTLRSGHRCGYLLESSHHTMALVLYCELPDAAAAPVLVARLFDPARPAGYLELQGHTAQQWLALPFAAWIAGSGRLKRYFGQRINTDEERFLLVQPASAIEHAATAALPLQLPAALTEYYHADAIAVLMRHGAHAWLAALQQQCDWRALPHRQRRSLLAAPDAQACPGLWHAMATGCTATVQVWLAALAANADIPIAHRMRLLEARNRAGETALYRALLHGHAKTVSTWIDGLAAQMDGPRTLALLATRGSDGDCALRLAVPARQAAVVQAWVAGVCNASRLTWADKRMLLVSTAEGSWPNGSSDAGSAVLTAWIAAIDGAQGLSRRQKSQLLALSPCGLGGVRMREMLLRPLLRRLRPGGRRDPALQCRPKRTPQQSQGGVSMTFVKHL